MITLRIHGRTGQPVTALGARVATDALRAGWFAQAWSFSTTPHRGPISAVVRVDAARIVLRGSHTVTPDWEVVIDPTLAPFVRPAGQVLLRPGLAPCDIEGWAAELSDRVRAVVAP